MGNEGSKKGPAGGQKGHRTENVASSSQQQKKSVSGSSSLKQHLDRAQKSGVLQLQKKTLKELPEQILQVASILRNLDLSQNKLGSIPPFIGDFQVLKQLHLDSNRLTSLPAEIGHLKKLETLSVRENRLQSLPDTILGCINLKSLNLSANQFLHFPIELCDLPKLDVVDLAMNRIENLPPNDIGRLRANELVLNQNRLNCLPVALANCPNLKVLRVEENCLNRTDFHAEILKQSGICLIAYAGNLFQDTQFQALDGYEEYQTRYTATKKKMF